MLKKLLHFYQNLWNFKLKKYSPKQSFLIHQARIFVLAFRGFVEDKIQLRASALTFYSLLSIVPVLALGFALAKGFGLDDKLKDQLISNFAGQETVLTKAIEFAQNLLDNTLGGYIAGVGGIVLIWSVMKVLGHIERSFNDIWQIKISRSFFRKFSDYLALMFISPLLFITASYFKVALLERMKDVDLNFITVLAGKFISFAILWLLFSIIYIVMPNTKVKFKYGIIAGIITGTLFSLLEFGFLRLQYSIFSNKYNAIYGAFAALPLFLLWMQYSWLIVLFGAEISFAYQNVENYEFESESLKISHFYKRVLIFLVLHAIIENFKTGEKPLTSSDLSHKLDMPIRLVREIIFDLNNAGLIVETTTASEKEKAFNPALDINMIDLSYVQDKLDKYGSDKISVSDTPVLNKIKNIQSSFLENIEKSSLNTLIKDL